MLELLVFDQGPGFIGHDFAAYIGENERLHHFIGSQSPWQQGRAERAGGRLKEDLRDTIEDCGVVTQPAFDLLFSHAVDVRNRYVNRSGFSTRQRAFCSSARLLGRLASDDYVDRVSVATSPTTEFHRSAEIRGAAQKALFKNMAPEVTRQVAAARSRVQPKVDAREGDVVHVWRSDLRANVKGWVEPGLIACFQPSPS